MTSELVYSEIQKIKRASKSKSKPDTKRSRYTPLRRDAWPLSAPRKVCQACLFTPFVCTVTGCIGDNGEIHFDANIEVLAAAQLRLTTACTLFETMYISSIFFIVCVCVCFTLVCIPTKVQTWVNGQWATQDVCMHVCVPTSDAEQKCNDRLVSWCKRVFESVN